MKLKTASLICSQIHIEDCPKNYFPEYAFLGRSNVGKSSLINLLTGYNNLAFTSSNPGKTRTINYFLINEKWYLVDLPGYGYIQNRKQGKKHLQQIIYSYLYLRQTLTILFLLIDPRHPPQKNDLEQIQFLKKNRIHFAIIFTKIDKLSNKQLKENTEFYQNILLKTWGKLPRIFYSSFKRKIGKKEILNYIEEVSKTSLDL